MLERAFGRLQPLRVPAVHASVDEALEEQRPAERAVIPRELEQWHRLFRELEQALAAGLRLAQKSCVRELHARAQLDLALADRTRHFSSLLENPLRVRRIARCAQCASELACQCQASWVAWGPKQNRPLKQVGSRGRVSAFPCPQPGAAESLRRVSRERADDAVGRAELDAQAVSLFEVVSDRLVERDVAIGPLEEPGRTLVQLGPLSFGGRAVNRIPDQDVPKRQRIVTFKRDEAPPLEGGKVPRERRRRGQVEERSEGLEDERPPEDRRMFEDRSLARAEPV